MIPSPFLITGITIFASGEVDGFPLPLYPTLQSTERADRFVNWPWPMVMEQTWEYSECIARSYYSVLMLIENDRN